MSKQSLKSDIRDRMAQTGENYTTARRAVRAQRRTQWHGSGLDTTEIRNLVASSWRRYADGTGRPALVTDTIPALCDEVDTLRAVAASVDDLAEDDTLPESVRQRLAAVLAADPVQVPVDLDRAPALSNDPLRVRRRFVPFPGGTTQGDFFRAAADRIKGGWSMGSNLTATVVAVLEDYAAAVDQADGTRPVQARLDGSPVRAAHTEVGAPLDEGRWDEYLVEDERTQEWVGPLLVVGRTVVGYDGSLWLLASKDGWADEWWLRVPRDSDERTAEGWLEAEKAGFPRTYWVRETDSQESDALPGIPAEIIQAGITEMRLGGW